MGGIVELRIGQRTLRIGADTYLLVNLTGVRRVTLTRTRLKPPLLAALSTILGVAAVVTAAIAVAANSFVTLLIGLGCLAAIGGLITIAYRQVEKAVRTLHGVALETGGQSVLIAASRDPVMIGDLVELIGRAIGTPPQEEIVRHVPVQAVADAVRVHDEMSREGNRL